MEVTGQLHAPAASFLKKKSMCHTAGTDLMQDISAPAD
jgi:hypothetical protein